jgi:PST family polysaccharide transporter
MKVKTRGTKKRLAENILSLYLLQGLNYVIPIFILPYLVRTIGSEKYGVMAFAQAFAQYISMLTDYGFNFTATRFVATNKEDDAALSRMFIGVMCIKTILYVLGFAVMGVLLLYVRRMHEHWLFFLIAAIAVFGNIIMPGWLFQGLQKMRYISVISGSARIFSTLLLLVYVHNSNDALFALGIQGLGNILAGMAGFIVATRLIHISWRIPTLREMTISVREGWHVFISTSAVSLYTNTNIFLVGLIAGDRQAGYFSAADKIIRALQNLITPLSQSIFPHINELASKSAKAAVVFIAKSLRWIASCTFLVSLSIFVLAPRIVTLLFGSQAGDSAAILRWTAFLPFLIGVSNVLGIQTMLTFRMDKLFSKILIVSGFLNVALAIPLIHLFLAPGAGMSVLITECAVTTAMTVVLINKGINVFKGELSGYKG